MQHGAEVLIVWCCSAALITLAASLGFGFTGFGDWVEQCVTPSNETPLVVGLVFILVAPYLVGWWMLASIPRGWVPRRPRRFGQNITELRKSSRTVMICVAVWSCSAIVAERYPNEHSLGLVSVFSALFGCAMLLAHLNSAQLHARALARLGGQSGMGNGLAAAFATLVLFIAAVTGSSVLVEGRYSEQVTALVVAGFVSAAGIMILRPLRMLRTILLDARRGQSGLQGDVSKKHDQPDTSLPPGP
jgi:hypothetical protein